MAKLDTQDNRVQNSFFLERIKASQFVLVGEQHGIQEAGQVTNYIFRLAHPLGYDYLCLETDSLAARYLERFSRELSHDSTIQKALGLHAKHPFAIPFYANYSAYNLFRNVMRGTRNDELPRIWGIDQMYFLEWGLAFSHLLESTTDADTKAQAKTWIEQTEVGVEEASALILYKYNETTHQNLVALYADKKEKRLLELLWKSREYNHAMFQGERHRSSYLRAGVMKENFTNYYNHALRAGALPKAVFKMGYDHLGKGRNGSNVYDIGNFAAELACYSKLNSFHIQVKGLNGYENHHGPFSPAARSEFDNLEDLPEEIQSFTLPFKSQACSLCPNAPH